MESHIRKRCGGGSGKEEVIGDRSAISYMEGFIINQYSEVVFLFLSCFHTNKHTIYPVYI